MHRPRRPAPASLPALALILVVLAPHLAHAQDRPPPALALVERIAPGTNGFDLGTVDFTNAKFTPLHAHLPLGGYTLAVHAPTARWALTADPTGDAALPELGGQRVTPPEGVITLVLGRIGAGVLAVVAGDPGCKSGPCFEHAARFSADGARVIVEVLRSAGTVWTSYAFDATPTRTTLVDKRRSVRGTTRLALSADGKRLAYWADRKGLYVEDLPALPVDARAKPKPPRQGKPVTNPGMLMDAPLLVDGTQVVYFRREPKEQKLGYIEVFDTRTRKATTAYTFAHEFPMWTEGFHLAAPGRTVIFLDDGPARTVQAFSLDEAAPKPRELARGVVRVLDVSSDGRWLLLSRRQHPERGEQADNPEVLVVVAIDTGKEVASVATGVPGARVPDAHFFAAPSESGNR